MRCQGATLLCDHTSPRNLVRRTMFCEEDALPTDVLAVIKSSALLGISEFRLFQLAYRSWHGTDVSDETIEAYFIPYMFREEVPHWVRHFTRTVLDREQAGCLDPSQFGVAGKTPTPWDVVRGHLYVLGLMAILAGLLMFAAVSAEWIDLPHCYFPPCY
jgi:hypothetical protein